MNKFLNIYNLLKVSLLSLTLTSVPMLMKGQEFEEILRIPWNTEEGIRTALSTSNNRGIADYEIINSNTIAILCDIDRKVSIYDIESQGIISEFSFEHEALNFTYDISTGTFYIIDFENVFSYCSDGNLLSSFSYSNQNIRSVTGIEAFEGDLYLNASGQNNYTLISNQRVLDRSEVTESKTEGWLLNDGTKAKYSGKINNRAVDVELFDQGISSEFKIPTGQNSHGIEIIGRIDDMLVAKEYFHKGNQWSNVFCNILLYSLDDKKEITKQEIPRIKFISNRSDIDVYNNSIFQLITTPENALLYRYQPSEEKSRSEIQLKYPRELDYEYHFNNHLKKEPKNPQNQRTTYGTHTDVGMRSEVLSRAHKYVSLKWNASEDNFPFGSISNQNVETNISTADDYEGVSPYHVKVPDWISTTETNEGMVYKWGGWTHYNCYNYHVGQGKVTGDVTSYLSGYYESSDNNVIGIDCSGFISRAWNLSSKHSTSTLPGETVHIWDDLKPGDLLNKPGSHVRMIVEYHSCSDIEIMESSGSEGKVVHRSLTEYSFTGYEGQAMPQNDDDYDLVFSDFVIDYPIDYYLTGSATIANIGDDDYDGEVRLAIYNKADNSASGELGSFERASEWQTITINDGREEPFSASIYVSDLQGNAYKIRLEYKRDKGDNDYAQAIPYEDYQVQVYDVALINSWDLMGRLFDDSYYHPSSHRRVHFSHYDGQRTSSDTGLFSGELKSLQTIEEYTNEAGNFRAAIPDEWEQVRITFPETPHEDVVYNKGDGNIIIFPDRHEFTNSGEFYASAISDGFRVDGCADDIVFVNNEYGIRLTPLSRPAFWLWGDASPCSYSVTGVFLGLNGCIGSPCEGIFAWEAVEFFLLETTLGLFGVPFDFEYIGDYITIFEECDQNGNIIPGGHRIRNHIEDIACGCDPHCWENEIYVPIGDLHNNTFYKLTLADDDFGWTESSRIIYRVPYLEESILVQNETINTSIKADFEITIKPASTLQPGFMASLNHIYYPYCSTGGSGKLSKPNSIDNTLSQSESDSTCINNFEIDIHDLPLDLEFEEDVFGDETNHEVFIYPRITNSLFHVVTNREIKNIEVFNMLGVLIEQRIPMSNNEVFDLSNQKPGIYFVKLTHTNNLVETYKIVKH